MLKPSLIKGPPFCWQKFNSFKKFILLRTGIEFWCKFYRFVFLTIPSLTSARPNRGHAITEANELAGVNYALTCHKDNCLIGVTGHNTDIALPLHYPTPPTPSVSVSVAGSVSFLSLYIYLMSACGKSLLHTRNALLVTGVLHSADNGSVKVNKVKSSPYMPW